MCCILLAVCPALQLIKLAGYISPLQKLIHLYLGFTIKFLSKIYLIPLTQALTVIQK